MKPKKVILDSKNNEAKADLAFKVSGKNKKKAKVFSITDRMRGA